MYCICIGHSFNIKLNNIGISHVINTKTVILIQYLFCYALKIYCVDNTSYINCICNIILIISVNQYIHKMSPFLIINSQTI